MNVRRVSKGQKISRVALKRRLVEGVGSSGRGCFIHLLQPGQDKRGGLNEGREKRKGALMYLMCIEGIG